MPKISKTERIALESGTTGVERLVFNGRMNHKSLSHYKQAQLSKIDKEMLNKVPSLAKTVNEYEILNNRITPASHKFWNKAKTDGFFSLIVPEEYGGKKMTSTGLSKLLQRLSSVSASIPVHVMVPNSLGPAELISLYGTHEQKEYFLPKLARGDIPCFGLTSLHAGSDAAGSMTDVGTVYVADDGSIRIKLTFKKRYITLAPVADIIGIAFKLEDKDGQLQKLCGRHVDGDITLALLERDAMGLRIGDYLDPLGVGFANGTIEADAIDIGIDDVIGGVGGVGNGWKFLMEALQQLAEARLIDSGGSGIFKNADEHNRRLLRSS